MSDNTITLLHSIGYVSTSNTNRIIRDCLDKAINTLGENCAAAFVHHFCSLNNIKDNELYLHIDLLEKSLNDVFGYGAELIMSLLKQNLSVHTVSKNKFLPISDIISQIQEAAVYDFLSNVPPGKHILLLYANTKTKHEMLYTFISHENRINSCSCGVITVSETNNYGTISTIPYSHLFKADDDTTNSMRLQQWVDTLFQMQPGCVVRIAGEDDTWFLENGLDKYLISLEKGIGKETTKKELLSILCIYDKNKIKNEDYLKTIIESHSYVITDNPLMLFEFTGRSTNKK